MTPTVGWILGALALAAIGMLLLARRRAAALKMELAGFYDSFPTKNVVDVHIDCDGPNVSIKVVPWTVRVRPGDDLEWVLHSQSNATMRIEEKDPSHWPFPAPPPQAPVPPQGRVPAGTVRPGAKGTYHYTIHATCDGTNLEIDPDIWVW
jgi:hypothetical protein